MASLTLTLVLCGCHARCSDPVAVMLHPTLPAPAAVAPLLVSTWHGGLGHALATLGAEPSGGFLHADGVTQLRASEPGLPRGLHSRVATANGAASSGAPSRSASRLGQGTPANDGQAASRFLLTDDPPTPFKCVANQFALAAPGPGHPGARRLPAPSITVERMLLRRAGMRPRAGIRSRWTTRRSWRCSSSSSRAAWARP